MENIYFYKIKKHNDSWTIIFQNKETEKETIIRNNVQVLRDFISNIKDSYLIGANNYTYDDILLTSLLKNGNLTDEVTHEDITEYLPITLDITQGIVRNSLIDFNNMVSSLWFDSNALGYHYALNEEGITKQLIGDIELIKNFYNDEERTNFLNWKVDVIKNYNLPKSTYHESYGDIMKSILGLNIEEESCKRNIKVDKKLEILVNSKNDKFLNELFTTLKTHYSTEDAPKLQIKIDDCIINFNEQGILGSMSSDYIDTDTKNNDTYLYIDFNSFGPNILINNNWLEGICTSPEKYSEVKDIRINLKSKNDPKQLYYKYLLNSGLDYLNKVSTKDGNNVGLSLTLSGIMTMMLLYSNIKKYNTSLIECNTDGLIVKCPKDMVESIKSEVKALESALNLSCDVDIVNRIVHFDTKNYVMEFENGKVKHLGSFGAFQTHPFYCTGVSAVELALREYYLNNIPVLDTLQKLRNENNLEAFQIVKRQKKNEKAKYVLENDEYKLYDRTTIRLFAVRNTNNPLYVLNKKNEFEEHKLKRGRSVKDGYYLLELSDETLPNIYDIDLTFYVDQCYKVINAHPKLEAVQIMNSTPKTCFIDLDGTLINDKTNEDKYNTFVASVPSLMPEKEIQDAYLLFNKKGGLLVQFLGICKKYKGYGTVENFASFLYGKGLFEGFTMNDYRSFVENYIKSDALDSTSLELFDNSKVLLDYLKQEGFNTILYSNWFKDVQISKLDSHDLLPYFSELCTIDDYFAKSSVKGWNDVLASTNTDVDDFNIMIGNGSSDLVPKSLNIPSIIVNHYNKKPSMKVLESGIIVNDFSEVMNKNFSSEMNNIKLLTKRR